MANRYKYMYACREHCMIHTSSYTLLACIYHMNVYFVYCLLLISSLGQFETYLFQKGESKVTESIKKCWCSYFSERVMSHRLDCGLPTTGLKMAVVIQVVSVTSTLIS